MKKLIVGMAVVAMIGTASAVNLVPNGDFSTPAGASWVSATAGITVSYPATGGNTGGYGQLDQSGAGWGGVLVSEVNPTEGIALASVGATAGALTTFTIDMINLGAGAPVAGMKIESWAGGALLDNSGDVTFGLTGSWATYTFDYTVNAGATSLKFVPLLVVQPVGSVVGFDNVGVVPEPATLGLFGLAGGAMLLLRRRI